MSRPRRGAGLRAGRVTFYGNAVDGYTASRQAVGCPWQARATVRPVVGQWVASWTGRDGREVLVAPRGARAQAAKEALDAFDADRAAAWRALQ